MATAPSGGGSAISPMASKPGLWQIKTSTPNMKGAVTTQMCMDQALGEKMTRMGAAMGKSMDCTTASVQTTPTGATVDSSCKMSGTTVTSHIVVTRISDTAFHQTVDSTFSPALAGKTERSSQTDGTWLGPCTADMKPGDMIMPGGMKINMASAMSGKPS